MKNDVLTQLKFLDYIHELGELEAKKTLFVLERVNAYDSLNDSKFEEVRNIASMFDGIVQGSEAKALVKQVEDHYSKAYPGSLMTRKESEEYSDVNYTKLLGNLGLRGFDFVLTVIQYRKADIIAPSSTVDEKRMLEAMRWNEQRQDRSQVISNNYHRKRGLELLGFDEQIAEILLPYSCVIANVYELVTVGNQKSERRSFSVREMKIHFIEAAEVIEAFYKATKPVLPQGYDKVQLAEGTVLLELANKGLLKDSEAVLGYFKQKVEWERVSTKLKKRFSEEECEVISKYPEKVKELIQNAW